MSMQSWLAEFYPQSSKSVAKESYAACCIHALTKWRGLNTSNLNKHDVIFFSGKVRSKSEVDEEPFSIDGRSCALCEKSYSPKCELCPIYKMSGQSCEHIWIRAVSDQEDGVRDMVALLEKTLAWLVGGEGIV